MRTLCNLFPSLLLLCVSVNLILSCGITDDISAILSESFISGYIDSELIPLIITRPLSGSAASAVIADMVKRFGADSRQVFTAAVMASSSDTCLYIHSTYFSCVSPKRNGQVLWLMLMISLFSCVICLIISRLAF